MATIMSSPLINQRLPIYAWEVPLLVSGLPSLKAVAKEIPVGQIDGKGRRASADVTSWLCECRGQRNDIDPAISPFLRPTVLSFGMASHPSSLAAGTTGVAWRKNMPSFVRGAKVMLLGRPELGKVPVLGLELPEFPSWHGQRQLETFWLLQSESVTSPSSEEAGLQFCLVQGM